MKSLAQPFDLYYADDGLLLSHAQEEAKENIKTVQEIAQEYGLVVNKEKSNVIIFNEEQQPENIEGIKVATNITYLGIKITNTRRCFTEFKKDRIMRTSKLSNAMYSIIARSCNRLMIGKTYWKGLGLATVLYGADIYQ